MEEPSGGESAGEAESRMAVEDESRMAVEEAAGAAEATGEEEREARVEVEPEPELEREDNQLTEAALPPVPAAGSSQEIAEDLSSGKAYLSSLFAARLSSKPRTILSNPAAKSHFNSTFQSLSRLRTV